MKLDRLETATGLNGLQSLEHVVRDRKGQYNIRINDPWANLF